MALSEKKALQTAALKVTEGLLKVYENCLPEPFASFSATITTSLLEGLQPLCQGFLAIPPSSVLHSQKMSLSEHFHKYPKNPQM